MTDTTVTSVLKGTCTYVSNMCVHASGAAIHWIAAAASQNQHSRWYTMNLGCKQPRLAATVELAAQGVGQ